MFSKVERSTSFLDVVNQIINAIAHGELLPGAPLPPERKLSEIFAVSRSVVREAISALSLLGVVERRWGRGNFISENINISVISNSVKYLVFCKEQEVRDLLEARKAIECELVHLAATRRTNEHLKILKKALNEYKTCSWRSPKKVDFDLQFHMKIAEAANSKILEALQKVLSRKYFEIMRVGVYLEDAMKKAEQEHQAIFEAIKEKNAHKAVKVMEKHIVQLENRFIKHLEDIKKKDAVT
ncbi:MAG: FadR family transcriptional regulator [Thermotogae bacterium]|nr:FadR family transcriptional regulator [Thermotogota bacterium]